jgi:taurine dioxygenase
MDPDASEALLDELYREIEVPEYQVRFRWEPDSIAFWDNRSTQHLAISDYWPQVRVMERLTIIGDRPY